MFALLFGVLIGVGLTIWTLAKWATSEGGRRESTLARADERIRQARVQAYVAMAEAVDHSASNSATPRTWPSERHGEVVDGVVVNVCEREG